MNSKKSCEIKVKALMAMDSIKSITEAAMKSPLFLGVLKSFDETSCLIEMYVRKVYVLSLGGGVRFS